MVAVPSKLAVVHVLAHPHAPTDDLRLAATA